MSENRKQILEMLAAGKISAAEAESLLAAVERADTAEGAAKPKAKYLRVQVEADEQMTGIKGATRVNVRVPMQLLRAGVRLASLIPPQAQVELNAALNKQGIPFTVSQIKPENLEELVDQLQDLQVDVDGVEGNQTKVRVFCE
jgi:hypothetical protein